MRVISREKGGGLPCGDSGYEPAPSHGCGTVRLSKASLEREIPFGTLMDFSFVSGFPRSRLIFELSWCVHSKVGGCCCPRQGHVSLSVREHLGSWSGRFVAISGYCARNDKSMPPRSVLRLCPHSRCYRHRYRDLFCRRMNET